MLPMSNNFVERFWSEEQTSVFTFMLNADGNLVVRARAGTGKTTTIVEAVKRWLAANPGKTVVVCAFNTRIAKELTTRFRGVLGVEVKTLHAVGFAAVRRYRERLIIEDPKKAEILRKDALARKVCGATAPDAILRMVAKLHTLGRETIPHARKVGDLTNLAIQHECEPDSSWSRVGMGLAYVEQKALDAMKLAADIKSGDTIDFADMIFLPVRNGWLAKQWDRVVVDEAQDMTTAQLEIAVGSVNDGGAVIVVGDDRQGIYGFRGADSGALDRLKLELNAHELGLKTTYRCAKAIVALAQEIVPDFEAHENNAEGTISEISGHALIGTAGPGDFILSRVNAPLVSTAMALLRSGKRARVAGQDIGKGLVALVRKFKARSVPDLLAKIESWAAREVSRHETAMTQATNGRKKTLQAKIETIYDQAEMLTSLADGARNVDEVTTRVEALFVDDGLGDAGMITCSSVHKAKGLEANRVFILADTLRGGTIEEDNIRYVAITRAKNELVWVYTGAPGQ